MSDPTRPPYEPEPTVPLDRAGDYRPYQPPPPYGQPIPYQPGPYGQPTPYSQPDPYEQPAAMVYLQPVDPRQLAYQQSLYNAQKSRLAAGLLAIFLGSLGVHNFYLGRTGIAVTQLLITVLTLGFGGILVSIWALIEGILILTRSPSFATDGRGIPLRE